jgi:endonuclease/exonuclease/phosphatase family metal-dependent hydrolase
MALDRKYVHLLALQPDIAIIPESANPQILSLKAPDFRPCTHIWVGENPNKGLSIFTFGSYAARLLPSHDPDIPYIAPLAITGPQSFNLLAVWACHAKANSYENKLGPLRRALTTYSDYIASAPTVIAGDFNDNVRWDKPKSPNKHSLNVAILDEMGLCSAYHKHRKVNQGEEPEPTLFWRDRTEDGPRYHIDYCFVPKRWLSRPHRIAIGAYGDWVGARLSDHAPLIVDVDL